jgi:hypothetical protein
LSANAKKYVLISFYYIIIDEYPPHALLARKKQVSFGENSK